MDYVGSMRDRETHQACKKQDVESMSKPRLECALSKLGATPAAVFYVEGRAATRR